MLHTSAPVVENHSQLNLDVWRHDMHVSGARVDTPTLIAPVFLKRSYRSILLFWMPLAATWMMMAAEGPFLAAVIARLADPKFNLAAFGVAFAIGILVEAPVIMLMSAATALVEDRRSYLRLRNFGTALGVFGTALLLLILTPPVFRFLMHTLLGLSDDLVGLIRGALWLLLPWPGTIGYRRFIQGVLIRSGRTRLVAIGTVLRLAAMVTTALMLYWTTDLPGAWVGAAALSVGVSVEAIAARWMAQERDPAPRPDSGLGFRVDVRAHRPILSSARAHVVHRTRRAADAHVLHGPGSVPSRVPGRVPGGQCPVVHLPLARSQLSGCGDRPDR